MTEYQWTEQRERFADAVGSTPVQAQLEQRIIDAFEQNPTRVIQTMNQIIERYKTGVVSQPWPYLANAVERNTGPNITVTDTNDRNRSITRAEQWIRTAGIHYDRETEVDDELFGDRGMLKTWKDDAALRTRILRAWHEARPVGEQLEADEIKRGLDYQASHKCPDCGRINPFYGRPCTCPQRRKRLLAEIEAKSEPTSETELAVANTDFWGGT